MKRDEANPIDCIRDKFLSYYPLKQGLKQEWQVAQLDAFLIFILLSIKTRIETLETLCGQLHLYIFLSYYPLKQGLKRSLIISFSLLGKIFILLSIKTRIETICFLSLAFIRLKNFYPTIH